MNNREFGRQLRLLALLRGIYAAVCGLSIALAIGVIIHLF